jgi:apolipoprotein N-acyltransferase
MIQISDLVGAYGVSFVIAAVNGWLVDMLIQPILVWRNAAVRRPRRVPVATVFTAGLVVLTIVYGRIQLASDTIRPGPRTAVCQQDYLATISGYGDGTTREQMLAEFLKLSMAADPVEPDLIVWPETASVTTLNKEFLSPETLADMLAEDPNMLYPTLRVYVGQYARGGIPTTEQMATLLGSDPRQAAKVRTDLARWYHGEPMDRSSALRLARADYAKRADAKLFFGEWDYGRLVDDALCAFAAGDRPAMLEPLGAIDRMRKSRIVADVADKSQSKHPPTWLVVGGFGSEFDPDPPPPRAKLDRYNSAYVYDPAGKQVQPRYDKVHCVLFGEYVPFRYGRLHWLYVWLNSITPWGASGYEYSLTAGATLEVYEMRARSRDGQTYRFGIPICYEDVMPYLCREFVRSPDGTKRVDFLLNISNDGWFNHSAELPQHLVAAVFRAVENRVGIARAVNTGISGFIDPTGRVYDCVTGPDGRRVGPGITGTSASTIFTDTRLSLYTRWGDWFAQACAILLLLMAVDAAIFKRWSGRRQASRPPDTKGQAQ